ncbi:MAG: hypothetical protein ACNA8W_08550 [Bradymonadaceae bacterium]
MQRLSFITICTLVALLTTASIATADERPVEEVRAHAQGLLMGTFVSKEHPNEVNRKIERAVRSATSGMNFLIRGKARSHLYDLTKPCKDLTFRFDDDEAEIQCEDRKANRAPVDGTGVHQVRGGGEPHELVHEISKEDRIVQFMRSKNGVRRDVYVVSMDGSRMTVHTTIQSRWLSDQVNYRLEFVRAR